MPTIYLNDSRGGMPAIDFGQNGLLNTSALSGVF